MPDLILKTSAGPVTLTATEPVPGLRVCEIPEDVNVLSPDRWLLAHHEGYVFAAFETESAATSAARQVGPRADWTRNAITVANQVGPTGGADVMAIVHAAGGNPLPPAPAEEGSQP